MKVGVLVATYNGIKFIKEQLDSILNQTQKVDEIIISDDGSTDGTFEFLNEYADIHKDDNIVVVKNYGEHGSTKNFENAFRNSTADILFFADQDDAWKPDKVDVFVKAFEKYSECGLVFSDALVTDDKLNSIEKTVWDNFFPDVRDLIDKDNVYSIIDRDYFVKRIESVNVLPGMSIAVTRNILENTTPFNSVLVHDDIITMYSAINSKICCINRIESFYRQHENNAIGISGNSPTRRNSLSKLIKNASMQLKSVLYDITRTKYYKELDAGGEYSNLSENYQWQKRRFCAVKANSFFAAFKLLAIYASKKHTGNQKKKTFILDLCLILFVRKKKRIEYFKKYDL